MDDPEPEDEGNDDDTQIFTKPHRRFEIEIKAGADSLAALVYELRDILTEILKGGTGSVGGGVSAGSTWQLKEDGGMTHDRYFNELRAYLDENPQ